MYYSSFPTHDLLTEIIISYKLIFCTTPMHYIYLHLFWLVSSLFLLLPIYIVCRRTAHDRHDFHFHTISNRSSITPVYPHCIRKVRFIRSFTMNARLRNDALPIICRNHRLRTRIVCFSLAPRETAWFSSSFPHSAVCYVCDIN